MGKATLQASMREGPHVRLAALAGEWQGTTRTWFGAGKLGNESPIRASLRLVLGGRFLLHEYECRMQGQPEHGLAIYGHHLDEGMHEAAWIDTFHTGSAIQFGQGQPGAGGDAFDVFATYFAGAGEPRWGWRTTITQPDEDRLLIVMYNVTPAGEQEKAVEFDYRRA